MYIIINCVGTYCASNKLCQNTFIGLRCLHWKNYMLLYICSWISITLFLKYPLLHGHKWWFETLHQLTTILRCRKVITLSMTKVLTHCKSSDPLFLLNVRIHCLGKHLYPPSNFPSIHDTNPKKISFVTLSMEVVVNVSRKYKTPTKRLTLRIPRQTLYRYYQTSYI